jgi:hypothetical protein
LQFLKLSETFRLPFTTERRVRERLLVLCSAGWVGRSQYATASSGAVNYYVPTRVGYQILHGPDAVPPTKRYFRPVGIASQHHTRSLADFIVHTTVAAHQAGVSFAGFFRENAFQLEVGDETLLPDCSFRLIRPDSLELSFFVELDNSTERIRSQKDLDSWERKIRLYMSYQATCPRRFRVLVVTTRNTERLGNILSAVAELTRNPQRSLFYGISLPRYLAEARPLTTPCFFDHLGRHARLVPQQQSARLRLQLQRPRSQQAPSAVRDPSRVAPFVC